MGSGRMWTSAVDKDKWLSWASEVKPWKKNLQQGVRGFDFSSETIFTEQPAWSQNHFRQQFKPNGHTVKAEEYSSEKALCNNQEAFIILSETHGKETEKLRCIKHANKGFRYLQVFFRLIQPWSDRFS